MKCFEDVLPMDKLDALAASGRGRYTAALPFPHIVIDDFLAADVLAELIRDFPGPGDHAWLRYRAPAEKDKLQSTSELQMPASIRSMILAFNSAAFVRFLELLTGIEGIVPDPHLFGGGMHQTLPGGHLKMHVDYNVHAKWKLDRRLNVLLYLNEDWREEWNGHLELWDGDARGLRQCAHRIAPIANRLVVFNTSERSWHGTPEPLMCPPDRTRKSLALYYYSNGRPEEERADAHNTVFLARPGEKIEVPLKTRLREWVPPALLKMLRR
jgi:Rps23 Pro-64 3,4-dihydroxylase Tpa1-like proline 4-hydroxylase